MVNKLRLIFLAVLLIPQGVMFGMAYHSLLASNKYFNEIEAASVASALMLIMVMPSMTVEWLVGKPLSRMRQLCYRVKQGNYGELLSLPNESRERDGEDAILILMRDMNWMARQIEIRESDLRKASDELLQSRDAIDEKNKFLVTANSELLAVQERLKERTHQLENACSHMQVMAMIDPLTSIANRRCFFETLERQFVEVVSDYRPISLLIIDIDFFKKINDTYGHPAGDKVLQELAKIIQKNSRHGDLAARIGGEEYGVLLPNTTGKEATRVANRIQMGIADHKFLLGNDKVSVTVSVGLCTRSELPCSLDREKLYQYADQALYYSKHSGRNSVSAYDPETHLIGKVA